MRRLLFIAIIATMTVTGVCAQGKMSNRTKVIANAAKQNRSANAPSSLAVKSVDNVDYITVFVRFNGAIDASVIEQYGGVVRAQYPASAIVTANIPVNALEALAAEESVDYIEAAQKTKTNMDEARDASNATKVMTGASPLSHAYKGTGVIVGVVDQEIQVNHVNFWNEARDRYRVKAFWNQNKNGKGGFGFTYGKFFTDSASVLGAKYDVTSMSSGHATHVTGIAAGADHTMNYYGIAGDADIVITSTTGEDADLTDGVKYIFQYADSVGKPCVINISMGSELGSHDGTDLCCQALEGEVKPGHVIVGAAGNSGSTNVHVGKDFTPTDTIAKTMMDFGYSWWSSSYGLIDVWGEEGNDFEFAIVAYNTSTNTISSSSPYFRASKDSSFTYNLRWTGTNNVDLTAEIATGISALNNKPNISLQCELEDIASNLAIGFIIQADSGHVDMWCNDYYSTFTDNNKSSYGWMSGDDAMSIGTGIAETRNVVAVGSYTNRVESYGSTVGDISSFSSKGPTADGRLKPEITAPGEGIYSSIPDKVGNSYWGSESEYTTVDGTKYYYSTMSGTSMSSPYVTGVVATWLQACPTLGYDDLVDIFEHTAKKDKYTGNNLPDNTWGYGKIDAYAGILYILGLEPSGVDNTQEFQIVALYPNPTTDMFTVGFASSDKNVTVSVFDLNGREIAMNTVGDINAGEERSFSIADAPDGVYIIRIAGEKKTNCYKIVKQ